MLLVSNDLVWINEPLEGLELRFEVPLIQEA